MIPILGGGVLHRSLQGPWGSWVILTILSELSVIQYLGPAVLRTTRATLGGAWEHLRWWSGIGPQGCTCDVSYSLDYLSGPDTMFIYGSFLKSFLYLWAVPSPIITCPWIWSSNPMDFDFPISLGYAVPWISVLSTSTGWKKLWFWSLELCKKGLVYTLGIFFKWGLFWE